MAREAGVSVPTVYRHFATKPTSSRLYPHAMRRSGLDECRSRARSTSFGTAFVRIARLDSLDDLARAAMASPAADEVRHASMPKRYERDPPARRLGRAEARRGRRDRLARLLVVLSRHRRCGCGGTTSALSVEEVADDVDWIVLRAIAAAHREEGTMSAPLGVRRLQDVRMADVAEVGGKAASLGELLAAGVRVPDGVVLTAGRRLAADERRSLLGSARDLGDGPFAVRSSGIAEDGVGALVCRHVRVGAGRGGGRAPRGRRSRPGQRARRRVAAYEPPATAAWR